MNLFQKIGMLLASEKSVPKTEASETQTIEKPKEEKPLPDAVKARQRLKEAVLAVLDSLYLSDAKASEGKRLLLWLDADSLTFDAYADFGKELQDYLVIERDYHFTEIALKPGQPDNDKSCKPVVSKGLPFAVSLQELNKMQNPDVAKKAMISVVGDRGKLLQEQYALSSEALAQDKKKHYNIGRGACPMLDSGIYRQNDIAIDDVNCQELNRCVSRAHAHIGFSELVGFYLQVEIGGSRLSGSRTRIFRGEEKIEVENPHVKEPLHDGDLIELGKAVLLKYDEQ